MLTNSDLPDCQSLWPDLEESHPALAIIRDASESMRPPRCPLLRSGCFVLAFRLDNRPITYDAVHLILSVLVAIAASGFALWVVSLGVGTWRPLALGWMSPFSSI